MSFTNDLTNIESFIRIRKDCPFCKADLQPILTNFEAVTAAVNGYDSIVIDQITARREGDCFKFKITYPDEHADVSLSVIDNSITFQGPLSVQQALTTMDMLKMHVELQCDCELEYYIASFPIDCFVQFEEFKYKIRPIKMWMEAFTCDHLWVQNDWDEKVTRIFNRNKSESIPIKYESVIDFEAMPKHKFINRIKTMVNFS
jgi:hypothetical protein